MKANFLITIAVLLLLLFTSCSYKTNMWHYNEAEPREHVNNTTGKDKETGSFAEDSPAITETEIADEIAPPVKAVTQKHIGTGSYSAPVKKQKLTVAEAPSHEKIVVMNMKEEKTTFARVEHVKESRMLTRTMKNDSDWITDMISAIFWGLIIIGLVIGLIIGTIAVLIACGASPIWILGGIVVAFLFFGILAS